MVLEYTGTIDEALMLDDKPVSYHVFVDGVLVDTYSSRATHAIDRPVAQCDIETDLPTSNSIPLGSRVEVQAGYGSAVGTIFAGTVPDDQDRFSVSGYDGRITAVGYAKNLVSPNRKDVKFPAGPISLKSIFTTLCTMREVPNFRCDETLMLDNATIIELGGVTEVDDGQLVITANTGFLSWMQRVFNLFGYYVYDRPGEFRCSRILTPPASGSILAGYAELSNIMELSRSRRAGAIINDWEIEGATISPEDSTSGTTIRTFPATVDYNELLAPLGYAHSDIRDDSLVTLELAEAVLAAQQITHGALRPQWDILVEGDYRRGPGDPIMIESVRHELIEYLWLTSLTTDVSLDGFWMNVGAWAGTGTVTEPGDDCVVMDLFTGTRHLGNEYLPNYKIDGHQGTSYTIPFTIPDSYSSLVITGFAHGTNSFSRGQESTASRFEIWQGGKKVADGELPRQREDLVTNYTNLSKWPSIKVALSGSLKAGNAELRIIAGYDSAVGDTDDFEFRNLTLTACGVGSPIYPD
jgi:hypothetical protein